MPLYGAVERKSPFWGKVNWEHRFVCSADPDMYYFKPDGSANVNNEAGIRAATEHLASLAWSEPGALSKDWYQQYILMGAGNGLMGGTFAARMELQVAGRGRDEDGVIKLGFEELEAGLGLRGGGRFRNETHPVEGFAIATDREFAIAAIGGIVVGWARELGVGDPLKVQRGKEFVELGNARVVTEGILLAAEQRR